MAENTAAGQDVGAVLSATDFDGNTLTYTLEGADAASFDIVTTSGSAQIRTRAGVTYDHEAKPTHTVTVKADDGNGGTDTVTVTVTVTDVDEPPGQAAAPSVSARTATAASGTSLSVTWTPPANTGPAIASYDLQYRQGASGSFTDGPQDVTGNRAAIASLAPNTSYEVQVRATNAEATASGRFRDPGPPLPPPLHRGRRLTASNASTPGTMLRRGPIAVRESPATRRYSVFSQDTATSGHDAVFLQGSGAVTRACGEGGR